jgi:hypothetical protein
MDYAQCALGRGVSEVEGWQGGSNGDDEDEDEEQGDSDRGGDARGQWSVVGGTATGGACSVVQTPAAGPLALSSLAPEPSVLYGPTDWGTQLNMAGEQIRGPHSPGPRIMG